MSDNEDICETCGGNCPAELLLWCDECRDNNICRCERCNISKVGADWWEWWGGVVCPDCVIVVAYKKEEKYKK
tara:strand:+ start:1316 stop:1534 length:219 start_codon:yes stop_codon:yes gene_type:complete